MKRFFVIFTLLLLTSFAEAKPEYALQIKTNRCTTCHVGSAGGGHRNLVGKAYGPNAAGLQSFAQQDLFGLDWRALAYTPVKKDIKALNSDRNGTAIMAVIPSVSLPFKVDKGKTWSLVYSHNLGGFSSESARDAYLNVKLSDAYRIIPQYLAIGRFSAPFGLMTDEHRTYVRQLTGSTWNDREMGLLLSGDFSSSLHYDLALVNGEQAAGTAFSQGLISEWGAVANLRYMTSWGYLLGVSASYYDTKELKKPAAVSAYHMLSLDGLTGNLLPGVFISEVVLGNNINHRMVFASDKKYTEEVADSTSLGLLLQWNYNFLPAWKLIVKFDQLIPDIDHQGDYYRRIGMGLRYFLSNQVLLDLRYEQAEATPLSEEQAGYKVLTSQSAIWALLQVKL